MSTTRDWLPGTRNGQLDMAKAWILAMTQNQTKWDIPTPVLSDLAATIAAANSALDKAKNEATRTPVATAACKTAFGEMIKTMRGIKDRYFKQPPLTDADFITLGLHVKDTTQTPIHTPTAQAEADVNYPGVHLLMLRLHPVAGTLGDAKADHGFRIYYGILPPGGATVEQATGIKRYLMKAAVSGEELPHSKFTQRHKELFDFSPEDSGKTAYFCIRYENSKGEAGPWGPMFSAVIP